MRNVAQSLAVQLQALEYENLPVEIDALFERAINQRAKPLLVLQNPAVSYLRAHLVHMAAKKRLPVIYPQGGFVDAGGVMSKGLDFREVYSRLTYYVDRILKGANAADLPVEQATKFELVINLKTAKRLGVTIPPKVLTWADRVIE